MAVRRACLSICLFVIALLFPVSCSAPQPAPEGLAGTVFSSPSLTIQPRRPTSTATPAPAAPQVLPSPTQSFADLPAGMYITSGSERSLIIRSLEGQVLFQIPGIVDEGARFSPDGSRLLYRGANTESLILLNTATMASTTIGEQAGLAFGPVAWSNDSEVVFATAEKLDQSTGEDWGAIYRISLSTDRIEPLTFGPTFEGEPAPSPNGRWIAYSANTRPGALHDIYLYDLSCTESAEACASTSIRLTSFPPNGTAMSPSWSPDSANLAFLCFDGESEGVCIYNIQTGTTRILVNTPDPERNPQWSPDGAWIAFTRHLLHSPSSQVFIIRPDGTGEMRISGHEWEQFLGWIVIK